MLLTVFLSSCGDGSCGQGPRHEFSAEPDTIFITTCDTIGTEMGEAPDVFAFIADAAYTPDGNIAVLDAGKISLQVFTRTGEELLSIGRQGSGPGEYQMPLGLAVTCYGYVISDIFGGKVLRYDFSGEMLDELTGFFPVPPVRIKGAGDRFLAADIVMNLNEEQGVSVSMDFVAYADTSKPSVVFRSCPLELAGGMVKPGTAPDFAFAAGPGGEVYLAEMCDSVFLLSGYRRDGSEFLNIREEFERIPLSPEELEEEVTSFSLSMENGETAMETRREPVTDTHRDIIEGTGVDSIGMIWVEMGDTGSTYFRVYSPEGELLHLVIADGSVPKDASYSISPHGILAWDRDPEDWPKIYLLEVR